MTKLGFPRVNGRRFSIRGVDSARGNSPTIGVRQGSGNKFGLREEGNPHSSAYEEWTQFISTLIASSGVEGTTIFTLGGWYDTTIQPIYSYMKVHNSGIVSRTMAYSGQILAVGISFKTPYVSSGKHVVFDYYIPGIKDPSQGPLVDFTTPIAEDYGYPNNPARHYFNVFDDPINFSAGDYISLLHSGNSDAINVAFTINLAIQFST